MAKVAGPLMSMAARGKVADAIVFSFWRGIAYVRMWLKPTNPKTEAQQTQRGYLKDAVAEWLTLLLAADWQAWRQWAGGMPYSGPNAYMSGNLKARVAGKTMDKAFNGSITPGPGTLTLAWTTTESVQGRVLYGVKHRVYTEDEVESPAAQEHSVVLTGLSAGVKYYCYVKTFPSDHWGDLGEWTGTPT